MGIDPYVSLDLGADQRTITRALNGNLEYNGKMFSIKSDFIPRCPSAKTLIGELAKGCPLIVGYHVNPESLHSVLVTWLEYVVRNGKPTIYQIRVLDPSPGPGTKVCDSDWFDESIVVAWTVNVSVYQAPSLLDLFCIPEI